MSQSRQPPGWSDSRTLSLIPRAIAINLVVGQVVAMLKLPVFLDSIGTVLVGCLSGPMAGAVTGILSNLLAGVVTSPTMVPFALVSAVIGMLAGWVASSGVFRIPWASAVAGALCGTVTAACSAPIAFYLFGGVTGGGTDVLVALFKWHGASQLVANFRQGLVTDPLDKALTFFVVSWVLNASSARLLDQYPRGLRALGRRSEAGAA